MGEFDRGLRKLRREETAEARHAETADEREMVADMKRWFGSLLSDEKTAFSRFLENAPKSDRVLVLGRLVADIQKRVRSTDAEVQLVIDSLNILHRERLIELITKSPHLAELSLGAVIENWNTWERTK